MYIITKTINENSFRITEASRVSGVVKDTTEETYLQSDYIQLSEAQATRYNDLIAFNENANENNSNPANEKIALKKLEMNYIITGTETPAPEPTLEDLKQAILKTLNQNYGAKVSAGYTHNGWVFNLDENTLSNIALQTNAYVVDDTENSFKISDRNKVQREFDRNGFKPFAKGFKNVIKPLMERYAEIKNQIDLAQNESELDIIDPTFPSEEE